MGGYLAATALVHAAWIPVAHNSVPSGTALVAAGDGQMIAWVLGWVAHAAWTGRPILEANINHPAAAQLTGSEHFASAQVLFAPLFAATGNALLSANLVAMATYPLSAYLMYRYLLSLNVQRAPAWVGGLCYSLGPLSVPGNLQVLQYQPFYLPLVALLVRRLARQPGPRSSALLGLGLTLGLLSSYYMAVMLSVLLPIAMGLEFRRNPRLVATIAWATSAILPSVLILGALSLPYLARSERLDDMPFALQARGYHMFQSYLDVPGIRDLARDMVKQHPDLADPAKAFSALSTPRVAASLALRVFAFVPRWFGWMTLALAVAGMSTLVFQDDATRRIVGRGALLCMIGLGLMLGPYQYVADRALPLPYWVLSETPARVFRYPWRFVILVGFGTAMMAGGALAFLWSRLPPLGARILLATISIAFLASRSLESLAAPLERVPAQSADIYTRVFRATRGEEQRALLELPTRSFLGRNLEWDAMIGSTKHWLPLCTGMTGYQPPHRPALDHAIASLPDPAAVQRIRDLCHPRWLLLRPADVWSSPNGRARAMRAFGGTVRVDADGWTLIDLDETRRP